MRGAERVDHRPIAAGGCATKGGLVVQGVGKPEPRSDAAVPVRRKRMGILPARTVAGEHQCAQASVCAGVRNTRIEVAEDVVSVDRRQVDLIPQAEVEGQAFQDAPVVLNIHLVGTILACDVTRRVQTVARCLT